MDENTHNPRHKRRSPEHVGFKDAPLGELRIGGRVWIEKEGATYIAWGRVVLLEHIERSGSISAAARSMGISYRHAWLLVEQMNKLSLMPLVSAKKGGSKGAKRGRSSGEAAEVIDVYQVDTGLLRELRELEQQAAKELGQWTERGEIVADGPFRFVLEGISGAEWLETRNSDLACH